MYMERRDARAEGLEIGMKALVETCQKFGRTKEEAQKEVTDKFGLSKQEAAEKVVKYWND